MAKFINEEDREKLIELIYYHLVAINYSDSIIESVKTKLNLILNPKNKNPEKYKEAYELLRKAIEKSQGNSREHREKAKLHLSKLLPEERLLYQKKRRDAENASLVRTHLNSPDENIAIEFKSADQLE